MNQWLLLDWYSKFRSSRLGTEVCKAGGSRCSSPKAHAVVLGSSDRTEVTSVSPATMPPSCRAKSSTLIHLGVTSVVLCTSGTRGRKAKLGPLLSRDWDPGIGRAVAARAQPPEPARFMAPPSPTPSLPRHSCSLIHSHVETQARLRLQPRLQNESRPICGHRAWMPSRFFKNILKGDLAFRTKAEEGLLGKGRDVHSWHPLLQWMVAVRSLSDFHGQGIGSVSASRRTEIWRGGTPGF